MQEAGSREQEAGSRKQEREHELLYMHGNARLHRDSRQWGRANMNVGVTEAMMPTPRTRHAQCAPNLCGWTGGRWCKTETRARLLTLGAA